MAEREQNGRFWLWIGVGAAIILVFFIAKSLMRERLPVREAKVLRQTLENTVSTNGRVEPVANYQFYSPVATTAKAVNVQPGDIVPAGKLMILLDDAESRARLASAESAVKSAQAAMEAATHNGTQEQRQGAAAEIERNSLEVDQARRSLDALTKLNSTGAASQNEVAAARERLASAEENLRASQANATSRYSPAEVERARAALADAEANLEAAREVEAKTEIRAPIAGTVYSLDIGRTEFAEEGKLLLEMADLHHERVRAYFDEPEIGKLAVGQSIIIQWNAKPGQRWHGHISRTPVTVSSYGTRTVGEVLIDIDGQDDDLLPDTNVTVTVTTSSQADALSVPREALHSEDGRAYVYKVVNDHLVRTPVTTGTVNLTREEILSGLNEGDVVAVGSTNGQPLQGGIAVKAVQ
jgi:HlyD family secretion protein